MKCLFLGFLLLISSTFHAQEEENAETQEESQDAGTPPPPPTPPRPSYRENRDVDTLLNIIAQPSGAVNVTSKILYKHNDSAVLPGDVISVLVGFENTGSSSFVVTDICASLTSQSDPPQFLRNYTALHPNITIRSQEIHTLEYRFLLDERINPNEYGFVVCVFYHDMSDNEFTHVAYNETLNVIESPARLDTRTFLIILTLLIVIIVLGVYKRREIIAWCRQAVKHIRNREFKALLRGGKKQEVRKNQVNTGDPVRDAKINAERDEQDEWAAGTQSMQFILKDRQRRPHSASPMRKKDSSKPRGRSTTRH